MRGTSVSTQGSLGSRKCAVLVLILGRVGLSGIGSQLTVHGLPVGVLDGRNEPLPDIPPWLLHLCKIPA